MRSFSCPSSNTTAKPATTGSRGSSGRPTTRNPVPNAAGWPGGSSPPHRPAPRPAPRTAHPAPAARAAASPEVSRPSAGVPGAKKYVIRGNLHAKTGNRSSISRFFHFRFFPESWRSEAISFSPPGIPGSSSGGPDRPPPPGARRPPESVRSAARRSTSRSVLPSVRCGQ